MRYYAAIPKIFLSKFYVPKKVIPTVFNKELFIILPYLGTMSSNLKQKLGTYFKNSLPQWNIKIIIKSTNRFSTLFRFQNVFIKELQSHIVYKFSCGNRSVTYYGKNELRLNVRSSEHLGIPHLAEKSVECESSTSTKCECISRLPFTT